MIYRNFFLIFLFLSILTGVSCTTSKTILKSDNYPYAPPFEKGKRFLISQAFNGNKTHKGLQNKYAVDIVMPIGSSICAARTGVIIEQVDINTDQKKSIQQSLLTVNYVRIKHDDNTVATYAHLKKNSISTAQGQTVAEGQCFAKSGNSGYSTGPHLHFVVQINKKNKRPSISFAFKNPKGDILTPLHLSWLYN